jgi:hypothetical protein
MAAFVSDGDGDGDRVRPVGSCCCMHGSVARPFPADETCNDDLIFLTDVAMWLHARRRVLVC